jgi:alcohol dehydrogenase class IV
LNLSNEPSLCSWQDFLAADLGRAVAWITPSVAARVQTERALATLPPGTPPPDDVDTLVVIGGGTLIDEAKYLARSRARPLRLVAVPTIWGSGAEASPIVVLDRDGQKTIHMGQQYLPDQVVDWPAAAESISAQRAREACGDCWAHALEGFLSPLARPELRRELADTMQAMLKLPLDNDPAWFAPSRRACAGQARSSVGLVHGIAHTLEGPLRKAQPDAGWHHARLCSNYLLPVMSFNASTTDKWGRFTAEYGLDAAAIGKVLRELFETETYRQTLPFLEQHWREVLRDRCTRTNSSLARPDSLEYFGRESFSL